MHLNPDAEAAGRNLKDHRDAIAAQVTSLYFEADPQMELGRKGARQKCTEDNRHHINYLSDALILGQPALFTDYAAWAATLLAGLNIPGETLASNFTILKAALPSHVDASAAALAAELLDEAIAKVGNCRPGVAGYLEGTRPLDILARDYLAALMRGERHTAARLILDAAQSGTSVKDLYLQVFQRALQEVGRLWQINRITVAQEHYCTASTQLIISQLYPYILNGEKNGGTFVGACVSGDLHEIGGRMVADFLEMAGWNTFYLGANTPTAGIVQTLVERKADVLGISATITHHVEAVKELIRDVRASPACAGVKILVGGYPFNIAPTLWRDVQADGTAPDAERVSALAGQLTGKGAG